jgi:hypothetical protein
MNLKPRKRLKARRNAGPKEEVYNDEDLDGEGDDDADVAEDAQAEPDDEEEISEDDVDVVDRIRNIPNGASILLWDAQ